MKGLLLAGGYGTRLLPYTMIINKHMLPVNGRPMITYGLESLSEARIRDVAVVVGPFGEQVRYFLKDGAAFGLNVTYIEQPKPLGISHAILLAKNYLGDDNFVVYLGDSWFRNSINHAVELLEDEDLDACIILTHREDPRAYGVASIDDAWNVLNVVEKPKETNSKWALTGCYVFSNKVHDVIKNLQPSARGELEISDALDQMRKFKMKAIPVAEEDWADMGRLEDIQRVEKYIS